MSTNQRALCGMRGGNPARRTNNAICCWGTWALLGLVIGFLCETAPFICAGQNWPMYRGDPALHGFAPGKISLPLNLKWTYKTGGAVKATPAIIDGRVYFGSQDSNVYALDLATGKKVWSTALAGEIESSTLVYSNIIYLGSTDGYLHALDLNGKELWKYLTEDKILGAPNAALAGPDSVPAVIVGSYDFKLHCVKASDGQLIWKYESGNYINGAPAIDKGLAVFGGCDALVHAISLQDGKQLKQIEAGAYIAGSAAVDGGKAYFGQYDNAFLCVDLNAGSIVWTYRDRPFPFFSSPALSSDLVVFGGRDKKLHCARRENGKSVWSFATRGKVDSSPVICGDKVLVGSEDGRLYCVSLTTGRELWSYQVGEALESSPAVSAPWVLIGSDDGALYAFKGKEE